MSASLRWRIALALLCSVGLLAVFLFQRLDAGAAVGLTKSIDRFIVNRTIRFFLNDLLAIGIIFSLFPERKYVVFSIYVQVAGVFLFLIPYFLLKIYFPGYNGPLISFFHRLILNPTLLLLLIPAFYYKRSMENRSEKPR